MPSAYTAHLQLSPAVEHNEALHPHHRPSISDSLLGDVDSGVTTAASILDTETSRRSQLHQKDVRYAVEWISSGIHKQEYSLLLLGCRLYVDPGASQPSAM